MSMAEPFWLAEVEKRKVRIAVHTGTRKSQNRGIAPVPVDGIDKLLSMHRPNSLYVEREYRRGLHRRAPPPSLSKTSMKRFKPPRGKSKSSLGASDSRPPL